MIKNKFILALFLIIALISGIFLISKIGQNISISVSENHLDQSIPTRKDIKVKTIQTGIFETSEGFIFAGGDFFKLRKGSHNATLIFHPKGNLLIDTGLGNDIDSQFDEMPLLLKPMFKYEKIKSANDIIQKYKIPISTIILTHMHWDHASGLKDFSNANIITTDEEHTFSESEQAKAPAYLKSQYSGLNNFQLIEFNDGHYEIFDQSHDLYKDGSIVLVKLNGHSVGSIGIFVNISKKERYFFTGDLTWAKEGFIKLCHKFYISSLLVDQDRELVEQQIAQVAELIRFHPELKVIPSHDYSVFEVLEKLE
ncbi:MAG: MBL fold metallo-hydrolase [Leptospira sp.]|nr:MBL fold metallo-hydrolase [Leptospira sp.]